MSRRTSSSIWAVCLSLAMASAALAVPPSDVLLPNSTKGYFSVPDATKLVESWQTTQIYQLLEDPVMAEFGKDLHRQLEEKWLKSHEKIGLSIDDIRGIATGEIAAAMVTASDNKTALVVLVDASGQDAKVKDALKKAHDNLLKEKAKHSQKKIAGVDVELYDLPAKGKSDARQVAFFQKDGMLVGADSQAIVADLLDRWDGTKTDGLASVEAYQNIMKRCAASAGELKPQLRWFVDPLAFAEAMRVGDKKKMKTLEMLRRQGFGAIQGIGGYVNVDEGEYEILHRTAAYAKKPFELAMRMLKFPNGPAQPPLPWVSRDVATYTTLNCDLKNAFESFGTLFDELFGEGEKVFEDMIRSTATDPDGPQIDMRKDLVDHLGERVTVMTDYKLPITPTSERLVFAAETKNEAALAATVEKSFRNDPAVKRVPFGEIIIWEMLPPEEELAEIVVENPELSGGGDELALGDKDDELKTPDDDNKAPKPVQLPNAAIAVAHGHLFVASHVDFLKKVLTAIDDKERLENDPDFQRAMDELKKLGATDICARNFSRVDEEYRITYELFRQNKLPEAETMLAQLINSLAGEEQKQGARKPKLDGTKLPEYDAVRRYLGTGGSYVTTQDDGWLMVGFTLEKKAE